jgi:hypothetical protein
MSTRSMCRTVCPRLIAWVPSLMYMTLVTEPRVRHPCHSMMTAMILLIFICLYIFFQYFLFLFFIYMYLCFKLYIYSFFSVTVTAPARM